MRQRLVVGSDLQRVPPAAGTAGGLVSATAGSQFFVGDSWQRRASRWQRIDRHRGGVNARSNPEDFVTKFADFWHDPSPERLPELLHPNVVLVQPLAGRMVGIKAAQAEFRRIWRCLPDLRADVDRWCGDCGLVFIEFQLHARVGGQVVEWPNVNRLVLCDGKAIERVTYFDPLAILPTLLRHPSTWWRWWRHRVRERP
jgi:SnoaL-like domain